MRSHDEQAEILIRAIWSQTRELKLAGLPARQALIAMKPGVTGLLQSFQDELLESQRETAVLLERALKDR